MNCIAHRLTGFRRTGFTLTGFALTGFALTVFTMIVAVLAAGFTAQTSHAAAPAVRVVQLPPVGISAKRIPVVQVIDLERVVIVGKRLPPEPTLLAKRGLRHVDAKLTAKPAENVCDSDDPRLAV